MAARTQNNRYEVTAFVVVCVCVCVYMCDRITRRGREYLTKWRDMGYEHCSWETLADRTYVGAEEAIKLFTELKENANASKKGKKKKPTTNVRIHSNTVAM